MTSTRKPLKHYNRDVIHSLSATDNCGFENCDIASVVRLRAETLKESTTPRVLRR